MKKLMLALLLLSVKMSLAQINNGNFETWDSTFTAPYTLDLDTTFGVEGATGGKLASWIPESQGAYGLSRSSDSQSGNYSVLLHNWYSYFQESIRYHDTISTRPQFLQGHYKYITGGANGLSQGSVKVALTRMNGILTDTVAKGTYRFDSAVAFTSFQLELNYLSPSVPDHIDIRFTNSDQQCQLGNVCHLLFLDDLTLTGMVNGIRENRRNSCHLEIIPNPVCSIANIQVNRWLDDAVLSISDAFGKKVTEITRIQGNGIHLNRGNLPNGLYLMRLSEGNEILASEKLLLAE